MTPPPHRHLVQFRLAGDRRLRAGEPVAGRQFDGQIGGADFRLAGGGARPRIADLERAGLGRRGLAQQQAGGE